MPGRAKSNPIGKMQVAASSPQASKNDFMSTRSIPLGEMQVGASSPQVQDELKNTMPLSRKALLSDIKVVKRAYLEIIGVEDEPFGVELGQEEISIGRSSDCGLHLPLDDASRVHARIFCRHDEYYIEDLGSTNGTCVNGVTISKCILRNNDQIEIGEVKIAFVETETRKK